MLTKEQFERLKLPPTLDGDVGQVLCVILAAAEPLHVKNELPVLSGVTRGKSRKLVDDLSQLFPVHDDKRVHVFHKSIVDWLTRAAPFDQLRYRHDFVVSSPGLVSSLVHGHHGNDHGISLFGFLAWNRFTFST